MKKINETFNCLWCKKEVPLASGTCRNHCPWCFLSLHVDGEIPGDRDTDCNGPMIPTQYEIRNGETKIHFQCTTCIKKHLNKAAKDDELGELDKKIKFWKRKYNSEIG